MIGDKARHTLKKCSGCSTFGKWYDTFPGKSTKKAATCRKVHKVVKDLKHTPPSSSPENVLSVFRNAYKDLTDRDLDEDIVKTPGSNLEKKKTAAEKKRYLREVRAQLHHVQTRVFPRFKAKLHSNVTFLSRDPRLTVCRS